MCGFAGEFLLGMARADLERICKMARLLRHRGPDESGRYLSPSGNCAIAFERLSVIDLASSHQPMSTPDGAVTIAFNGEIYNFRQLRQELAGQGLAFRTAGDTEVLLNLYLRDDLAMLAALDGMFAFAIHDARKNRLVLARDRIGEKPLWYAAPGDRVVFASEAKALLQHPSVDKGLRRQSVIDYVSLGYVHAPHSIWQGISKLPPGHVLVVEGDATRLERYWWPQLTDLPSSPPEQMELVRQTVRASVQSRLVADVPLGALLSGGIDSSVVVALMCQAAGNAGGVKTFCAGFEDPRYDERPAARAVAEHCGSDHTELLIRPQPSAAMIDEIVERYDEPFADSSAIPTFLICQAVRRHAKVALTGDGGDEMFGGYDRYRALHLAQTMSPFGYLMTRIAASVGGLFAGTDQRGRLRRLVRFAKSMSEPSAAQYLAYRGVFLQVELYQLLTPEFVADVDVAMTETWFTDLFEEGQFDSEIARAQRHDLLSYLPDDLLVKSDIASMASSLELRAPLLDHRLAPIGLSLPAGMKVRHGRGKYILRAAFADLLPAEVLNLPKRGFGIPLGGWLRNQLAEVMKETLLDSGFLDRGIIRREAVEGLINDHLWGLDDHSHRLWALLVLARWLAKNEGR